jgi:CSLREA domain-containing protein
MKRIFGLILSIFIALVGLSAMLFGISNSSVMAEQPGTPVAAIVVNTLQDELNSDGDCSLREAIAAANTNAPVDACGSGDVLTDTITFDVAGTITVTSQLSVTAGGPLVIDGGEVITTSGGRTNRVWWVEMGSEITLQHMVVTDGFVGWNNGAGLYNNAGNLTIIQSKFVRNRYTYNSFGGGIFSLDGTLNVLDSLIAENGSLMNCTFGGGIATWGGVGEITRTSIQNNESYGCCFEVCVGGGGGLSLSYGSVVTIYESDILSNTTYVEGGGIQNEGTLAVVNSTLSGNHSGQEGGAIANYGTLTVTNSTLSGNASEIEYYQLSGGAILNNGTLSITNSTLTGNHAWSGGAIANGGTLTVTNGTFSGNSADGVGGGLFSFGSTLTAINTIVANSLSGGDCSGVIIDGGHNISSGDTCGFDPANGSMPNTDPLLGPIQDNGGPTWTQALLSGSPAIDAGDDAQCPPTDQRGVPRPQDGDGDGNPVCDIGSYEFEPGHLIVTTLDDIVDPDDGLCSLREALDTANTNSYLEDCGMGDVLTDTITFDVSGTITVTSHLSVTVGGPLVVDGGSVITTSGGGSTPIWVIHTDANLTLLNLTTNGGHSIWGGGIHNSGELRIINNHINNNFASYCWDFNCYGWGGGIYNQGVLYMYKSTLRGNGALSSGGGIFNTGYLQIINSTLSENTALGNSGAIRNEGGTLLLINSTLFGNNLGSGGSSFLANTIITDSLRVDCYGIPIDGGNNISSDDTCGFDPANGSMPNTDPLLGPLQDNGGPTLTHALKYLSPAIDAGDNTQCPPTDQRGVPRPLDGNGDGEVVCDIGSYEVILPAVSPTWLTITGLSKGVIGESYTFTATVDPVTTTLPLTFSWQTKGQPPVVHSSGLTDTISFTWDTSGTHAITVTAGSTLGSVTDTHTITISDVPISGLVASYDSPTLLGTPTTFTATVEAGTNISFTWDFGDEATGEGAVVTHTYAAAGIYTATVTAGNSAGSAQASIAVYVVVPGTSVYLPVIIQGVPPGIEGFYWRRQE